MSKSDVSIIILLAKLVINVLINYRTYLN